MESNDELNKINIKNSICYYSRDINKIEDFDHLNRAKIFQFIQKFISYKSLIAAKSLCIRFDKIIGFIKIYDGTRYLVLFGSGKYDSIYSRIKYLMRVKSGITYVGSHNYAKFKVDS